MTQDVEFSPQCDCEPRCESKREHYRNNWWCPPCRWDYALVEGWYMRFHAKDAYRTPAQIVGSHNAVHTKAGHPKPPDRPTSVALEWQQSQNPNQIASEERLRARGLLPANGEVLRSSGPSPRASQRRRWTRDELLVALSLYLRLPFGQLHGRHPEIIEVADLMGRTPSALAMKLTNLAGLDDSLDRAGLRNASKGDREIWAELQEDWDAMADEIQQALARLGIDTDEAEDEEIARSNEAVLRLTKARPDQRWFRNAVLSAYEFRCCVTRLSEPQLLEAAHIVPWSDDSFPHRSHPTNGLCLSVLHHRAFDRGLITFDDEFCLVLSPQLARRDDAFIGTAFAPFEGKPIAMPTKFAPDPDLLAQHRERIFLA